MKNKIDPSTSRFSGSSFVHGCGQSFPAMEVKVLHEGNLEKCSSADDQGKKDWRKRYFVFKHFPASSTRCLEYYKDKNWRKQDPKGVLTLHAGYDVVKVHDSKRKYVFDVKTLEHVFRLSAHSEDELNKWILTLEKENIVKSFAVEPVPSDVMDNTGAKDMCHLHIADTEVRLVSAQNGNQLVAWPFTCLRRYMSSRGKFSLEAGRRAPTGQGSFDFITSQHEEIYKLLDNVIKSRAGKSGQTATPPNLSTKVQRSNSMQSSQSINMGTEQDDYDHLMCSTLAGVKPAHPVHPNYDQNIIHSLQKTDTQKSNDYASPYGHMKGHEPLATLKGQNDVDDDGKAGEYNTLDHDAMMSKTQNNMGIGYDILNPSIPQKPPPPLPTNPDLNLQPEKQNGGSNSSSSQLYDNNDTNNSYDSLDHQTLSPKQGLPAQMSLANAFDKMRQGSIEADSDAYNVLSYPGSNQYPQGNGGQNTIDEYSMLDRPNVPQHTPLRHSRSQPLVPARKSVVLGQAILVPPPRVPFGGNDRISQGYDRSSVSSMSSIGSSVSPPDISGSNRDSQMSMSPEHDFYSSIDNERAPPAKVQPGIHTGWHNTRTGPESPTEPKPIAPKPRKTRNTEHKTTEQKHIHSNLVSNLKASLLADGLNLNKIIPSKIAQRKLSADSIQEDMYAEVDDSKSREKANQKTRLVRSPSAPMDPIEDIYEDPEKASYR